MFGLLSLQSAVCFRQGHTERRDRDKINCVAQDQVSSTQMLNFLFLFFSPAFPFSLYVGNPMMVIGLIYDDVRVNSLIIL